MTWNTSTSDHITRSEIWSRELKEILRDTLNAESYVRWLTDFPDGTQFTIPSIGTMSVQDYVEDTPVVYTKMDTGEFTFTITDYLSSATYITNKNRQDIYYMSELLSRFVPEQNRAIMERVETDILALANSQTASDPNAINGAAHRYVGTDGSDGSRVVAPEDVAYAKYALKKAHVPMTNLIGIVDPVVAYHFETETNLVNISNNPHWEGIIETGLTEGMRFIRNVYGFDIYENNYLPTSGAASESIDRGEGARAVSAANGVANIFCSMARDDVKPFVGAWRQEPNVDSEYNKDLQREEYVTTARYGFKLFRPENLVVVLADDNTV